jgi:hypothetical protein
MLAQTYNSLIEAFGNNFNDFSFRELARFCSALGKVGLRHEEIISESVKRLVTGAGKQETTEEGAASKSSGEQYLVSFNNALLPFFETITHLDLP